MSCCSKSNGVITMTPKTVLILVDVQNDFHPGGSLAVPNSDQDAERVASLIKHGSSTTGGFHLDQIVATMDTHHKLHIAHPRFWTDHSGAHPPPFTLITSEDVKGGKWTPRADLKGAEDLVDAAYFDGGRKQNEAFDLKRYCIDYTSKLEESGKFLLCIWPEHCLIGTNGHCMVEKVNDAMDGWIDSTGQSVNYWLKGHNLLTEMYSVFRAEVPISAETAFDKSRLESLLPYDRVLICGQASSHCVNYTVRDLVDKWPENERNKIFVMTDCSSPVPSFEEAETCFFKDMEALGVNLCTSAKFMEE